MLYELIADRPAIPPSIKFGIACSTGHVDAVRTFLLQKDLSRTACAYGVCAAIAHGHLEVVRLFDFQKQEMTAMYAANPMYTPVAEMDAHKRVLKFLGVK